MPVVEQLVAELAVVDPAAALDEPVGEHADLIRDPVKRAALVKLLTGFMNQFRDRGAIVAKLESFVPLSQQDAHEVFARAQDLIIGTIYGSGVVAIVQGSLAGLAFWAVRLLRST